MILKNEIPILEFDTEIDAIITPTHENLNISLPKKAIFAFLIDTVEEYAKNNNAIQVATFESATKLFPIYVVNYKDEDICLVHAPVGSAPATQILDWLIGYGVEKIISTGSCGVLEDIGENEFILPYKALRDEGTSYHYMAPSRFIDLNPVAIETIEKVFKENNIKYKKAITWTNDGFYRETKEKVLYRKSEGCSVVEMECAALTACAQFRGATFGQFFYTADTLANLVTHDARDWGKNSKKIALKLALEIVRNFD